MSLRKKLEEKAAQYESQISWLTEQLKAVNRSQYGKKSERWESEEQVKMVFNEAEVEASKAEATASEEGSTTEVKPHQRKVRGHRKPLPEDLPREVIRIELPEGERKGENGEPLKQIGWEISEKLKYEPAKMSVIEYHRAKYGIDSGDYVKTAPPVPSVIPKGIATPELLSSMICSKYSDGLPLYRIEETFKRIGVDLARSTMARWMVQVGQAMIPIFNILQDRLNQAHAVACDETKLQVLREKGRSASTDSWMIVRCTPCEEEKIALFNYSTSRSGATIQKFFDDFKGNLLCDGLNSYDGIESEKIKRFGCHMHARRKFEAAAKIGAKSGQGIAAQIMNLYSKFYLEEEKIKLLHYEERRLQRLQKIKPILEEIQKIVEENRSRVPDKSKLGEAFRYFINELKYLMRFLDDGKMDPDNGFAERVIRKFAIGRNNWLFCITPEGADASSIIYSLVITARLNEVNPFTAITEILRGLPLATSLADYEKLASLLLKK
jgi:transposase